MMVGVGSFIKMISQASTCSVMICLVCLPPVSRYIGQVSYWKTDSVWLNIESCVHVYSLLIQHVGSISWENHPSGVACLSGQVLSEPYSSWPLAHSVIILPVTHIKWARVCRWHLLYSVPPSWVSTNEALTVYLRAGIRKQSFAIIIQCVFGQEICYVMRKGVEFSQDWTGLYLCSCL